MPDIGTISYSIRKSARTKRLHIKINRLAQVEVVTPHRVSVSEIECFVRENIEWIKRQQAKIFSRAENNSNLSFHPPEVIDLPLLKKTINVEYTPSSSRNYSSHIKNSLVISAMNDQAKYKLLHNFLQQTAKTVLPEMLQLKSRETGLLYNRVFIKAQKTRWGSCSAKKNINLNRNLLFLNTDQVEYLLTHELCHTVHLNHSNQYWNLVAQHCPQYKILDASLRKAALEIPLWALI